ncbi:MAG: Xaa-Pro peptidase family protein [Desulfitobacteriaceae bacterium]
MFRPSLEELQQRIAILQTNLSKNEVSGALIFQNADLYYYTGRIGHACFFVPVEGTPIFLSRQPRESLENLPWTVQNYNSWSDLGRVLKDFSYPLPGQLGLEFDVIPTAVYFKIQKIFKNLDLVDISLLIRKQRAIKSAWEIAIMQETACKNKLIWDKVPEMIAQSKTDLELSALFEAESRRQGHMGIVRLRSFNMEMSLSCVLGDEKGALPSHIDSPITGLGFTEAFPFGASGAILQPGKPISIDFGGCYAGYIADQTRMFAINQLDQHIMDTFNLALTIQEKVVSVARAGITCGELYELARGTAIKAGAQDNFMGANGGVPYIGHGVGLEIDELPVVARGSKEILEEGMIIALEPKFALPGIGAVGIENCYEVQAGGLIKLSLLPDDLRIVKVKA